MTAISIYLSISANQRAICRSFVVHIAVLLGQCQNSAKGQNRTLEPMLSDVRYGSRLCGNGCCFSWLTVAWVWRTGFPLLRRYLPSAGLWAGYCGPVRRFGRIGRSLERRSAYALIAAINGPGPMMFMTRLRL